MGDGRKRRLGVQFVGSLRLEFYGARIISDVRLFSFERVTRLGTMVALSAITGKGGLL